MAGQIVSSRPDKSCPGEKNANGTPSVQGGGRHLHAESLRYSKCTAVTRRAQRRFPRSREQFDLIEYREAVDEPVEPAVDNHLCVLQDSVLNASRLWLAQRLGGRREAEANIHETKRSHPRHHRRRD